MDPMAELGSGGMGECGEQEGKEVENRRYTRSWFGNPGSARSAAVGKVGVVPASPLSLPHRGRRRYFRD